MHGLSPLVSAWGAAHLPGMVASMTALPVIRVPVKGSTLDGVDSLHNVVRMPLSRRPTVAINNSTNVGLLTLRILAASSPTLIAAMDDYFRGLEKEVTGKMKTLEEVGWERYVAKRTCGCMSWSL
ncbi:Phosphoribosylaminoimidazole carboxylase pure domain-containing protein [Lyophyllum atratum]|nr:Phosphoribosylaminoimidazole carboxylase pure domain-containing protein [Lyophyllum atratum]